MQILTGQSIGRYHVLEQLGEGGMAVVYKAYDTRLERNVAFKVLRTDLFGEAVLDQVLKRFEREAKSLAKLKHPNIVNILDFGEHEGMPFLVMEFLPGGTLKQRLGQAIPWQKAFRTLLPVARGLSYAHQHGIIHRDVKPANILMDENDQPVLTDFGIAKLLEGTEGHTLTGSGVGIGTPEYMAPEQGIGAHVIDARADIYSLGIVLYEMITGRKPYVADTPMAVVLKQMTDPLPRPTGFVPDLPEGAENILIKALAKQAKDRYEDMNALMTAMEAEITGSPKLEVQVVSAPLKPAKKTAAPRVKRSSNTVRTILGIFSGVVIIVLGILLAPRMSGLFVSPASTNTVMPTVPSTVMPSSTATPTVTLTRTSRPKSTTTPVPSWVTDFAEPILAEISKHPPTVNDDLHDNSGGWVASASWNSTPKLEFVGGELLFGCWADRSKMAYKDFVLEFDTHFIQGAPGVSKLRINFRRYYLWEIDYAGNISLWWEPKTSEAVRNHNISTKGYGFYRTNRILIIIKGNQYALYVNDIPIYYWDDRYFFTVEPIHFYADCQKAHTVALDNLKIWDLETIPNLP